MNNHNFKDILVLFFFPLISFFCTAQSSSLANYSFISFSRYLSTCDESFDFQFSSNFQSDFKRGNSIIWAAGEYNQNGAGNQSVITPKYHSNHRGNKVLNLFESFNSSLNENKLSTKTFNSNETFQINLSIDPILISSRSATQYYCQPFELPYFASKPHIIHFQPIINQSNAEYIHHVFIYYCSSDLSPQAMAYRGFCFDVTQPRDLSTCNFGRIIYGWTVGGLPFTLPPETGIPLKYGPGRRNFISLEIHYNNPNRNIFVDSTGIQMTLTYQLRRFDSAVAIIERNVGSFRIPPTETDFKVRSYCPEECTKSGIPSEGIYIYANLFHAHLAARNFQLQHIRNKTELEPIDIQDNFNFDFQRTAIFPKPVIVLPGDELLLTCGYNTMDRTSDVGSGLDTRLEMCVAYVFYYRTDIDNQNHSNTTQQNTVIPYINDCRSAPEPRTPSITNVFCSHLDRGHKMNPNTAQILYPYNSNNNLFHCLNPPSSNSNNNSNQGMLNGNYLTSSQILSHLNEYSHSSWLDQNHIDMKLFWNLTMIYDSNNTIINGIISFAILHRINYIPSSINPTRNWFGIGLSPTGDMINSDIYIGIVEENSKLILLSDRFATEHSLPLIDSKQDLFNIQGGTVVIDSMNMEDSVVEENSIYKSMNSAIPLFRCDDNQRSCKPLLFPTPSSSSTAERIIPLIIMSSSTAAMLIVDTKEEIKSPTHLIIIIISLVLILSVAIFIFRKIFHHYYTFRYSAVQI